MEEKLKKAFSKATLNPPEFLAQDVWSSIVLYDRRINRLKLWVFSLIGLSSFLGLIQVSKILLNDFAHSGFYEYISLAFSSGGAIINYWRDFLSSLAESLPVISITLSLGLVFIFLLSLKYAMRAFIINNRLSLSF